LYLLDFVAILQRVIGPRQTALFAVRHGRRRRGRAPVCLGLFGALFWAATGCIPAATEPNNPRSEPRGAPVIVIDPAQDTTVDSLGTLEIAVAVHDPAIIDSVLVVLQGTAPPYYVFHPADTLFQAIITMALGPLKHTTFSYSVSAANLLGKDTTTQSVNVRVR
jgi:hypothetical protein